MGTKITHIRRTGEPWGAISHVGTVDDETGEVDVVTIDDMVAFIRAGGEVYTKIAGRPRTSVHVVESYPPFIRTDANDSTEDNLLSLPRF